MATYIIGDLQGCYKAFTALLQHIDFNPNKDTLWLAGDLINRGDNSLATLRLIYQNRHAMFTVLGNHDLHLLSTYFQSIGPRPKDTFHDILLAPDAFRLIQWLQQQPMCHYFDSSKLFLSHAGLYPNWSIQQALKLGQEVSEQLKQSQDLSAFFKTLYGDFPNKWNDDLTGPDRLRFIVNALTRMRYLDHESRLDMSCKSGTDKAPKSLAPWFNHTVPLDKKNNIAFGHWASLEGNVAQHTNGDKAVYALDTGCVWGGNLTCLHLESKTLFTVKSRP